MDPHSFTRLNRLLHSEAVHLQWVVIYFPCIQRKASSPCQYRAALHLTALGHVQEIPTASSESANLKMVGEFHIGARALREVWLSLWLLFVRSHQPKGRKSWSVRAETIGR